MKQEHNISPLLEVHDLAVSFANRGGPRLQAVDGVSFSIYPGQTLALVGESGCGKSVTAMSILRLLPAHAARFDRGQVLFRAPAAGSSVDLLSLGERDLRAIRGNHIAVIFQEPMTSLNPVYSVGDQIVEAVQLHQQVGAADARRIALDAMRDVGIPEPDRRIDQYPHQFSGGMRQRVMIAMALACKPSLLLADEPTTALDVTIQAQILELLRDLKQHRALAILLITHDLGVVAENADVVCVMYAGRVVEYATVDELFARPLHPYTRGLLSSIPRLGQRRDRLVTIREIVDNEAEFAGLGTHAGLRPWWSWHPAPAGVDPARPHALVEVGAGHWVGVWNSGGVGTESAKPPDLRFRRLGPKAAAV